MNEPRTLDELPLHPVSPSDGDGTIRLLQGGEPRGLTIASLSAMPQTTVTEDFTCEEGWRVPRQRWQGVRVSELLDPAPSSSWVEFAAGDFCFSLPVAEARGALVALSLNGKPLAREQGGPSRLLVPGAACFTSIKWLERIEVRADEGPNNAAAIARSRISGT